VSISEACFAGSNIIIVIIIMIALVTDSNFAPTTYGNKHPTAALAVTATKSNVGLVIGPVIGSVFLVIFLAIVAIVGCLGMKKKKKKKKQHKSKPASATDVIKSNNEELLNGQCKLFIIFFYM